MRYDNLENLKDLNGRTYKSLFDLNIPIEKFKYKKLKYNYERLDHLADIYYNDGRYWWVIALFNKINNPLKIDREYILIPTSIIDVVNYVLDQTV